MEVHEIERDLVRWPRGKWAAVIATLFIMQVGLLIWGSQKQIASRENYPKEPKVALTISSDKTDREWLEMENPFLFAAASHNGFSGEAWLRQPKWQAPEPKPRDQPKFLQVAEAQKIVPRQGEQGFALVQRHRITAELPKPPPARIPAPESKLNLAAFGGRPLATPMTLPLQYHNDVLSPTVVEAMIDRDGLVISARLIENSGSPKADAEALALARQARFAPARSGGNVPDSGKLIFEWFALNLGDTNNVKR